MFQFARQEREDVNVDTYLGPRESWGFWMLKGSDRDKRHAMRARLEDASLRPTWQRMKIGLWVFEPPTKHFTPEDLFRVMQAPSPVQNGLLRSPEQDITPAPRDADRPISLATIYNTLNAFADSGLLSTVTVASGKRYYDTNTTTHFHLLDEGGRDTPGLGLVDVPVDQVLVEMAPSRPPGYEIEEAVLTLKIRKNDSP